MSQIHLKIIEKVHKATIRLGADKQPEVVPIEELRVLPNETKLGRNTSTAIAVEIGQQNTQKRKMQLRIHKIGDIFELTQKYIVRDDDPEGTTESNTDTIQA